VDLNFVNQVRQAFGQEEGDKECIEAKIYYFLMDNELAECKEPSARWKLLWEKINLWKKEYLLWKDSLYYICGVTSIYDLLMCFCRLRLPEPAPEDWIEYLYHMSLVAVGEYEGEEDFIHKIKSYEEEGFIRERKDKYSGFEPFGIYWYFVESGYEVMTSKEWISELENIGRASYERYQGYLDNVEYRKIMEKNYPKYKEDLDYLKKNVPDDCTVVRVNKLEDDQEVWYIAKTEDSLYIIIMYDEV